MRNILLFIWLFGFWLMGKAQIKAQAMPEYVAGQIIVQLVPSAAPAALADALKNNFGKAANFRLERVLVKEMNIALYSFDAQILPHAEALRRVRLHGNVRVAQNNHVTRARVTPNDPLFSQQWQYINTGSSGGVVNADIDADLAWNITTGGVTPLGDTIVICVVDDGIDLTHQDLMPNLWRNRAEIPNNGQDDDGNGYIDDVRGWNTSSQNDDIDNGTHGTSVAGIIGAKGNNGVGVSGVNWDVKLMVVNGGGDEAEAIEAYTYPLRMRRLYNQSGGAQGAYIVATNSSWGSDNLQAADAPLWCAFYDSLGAVGIVSVGATANRNVNVDVVGDMPSSCRSPFLITVTNLRRNDAKEFSAGYGANTIQLGAYGTSTYTTIFGDSYGTFGGTSGATPHVTGTVGLIFAAPCLRLASIAAATPEVAALMVKDFILQGVEPNTSLAGITTTGGRLNTNNAVLRAITSGCAVVGCYTPFAMRATNISGDGFRLSWRSVDDAQNYLTRYRLAGDTTWILGSSADSFVVFSGLLACSTYEVQIAADCDTSFSSYTNTVSVKTGDCCNAPTTFTALTTTTTANFVWAADAFVQRFYLQYRIVGDTIWRVDSSSNNILQLQNLAPCTRYEAQIYSRCAVNVNNNISPIIRFKTKGCGTCEDAAYCANAATDANYEWIRRVRLGTLLHNSNSNGGYADFAGLVAAPDLQAGDSIDIELVAGQNNSSPNWRWRVWIDTNQDGIFSNTTELVFDSGAQNQLTTNARFFVPYTGFGGLTRMRVSFKWGSALATPCDSYNYGEIEDYCVNILAATAVNTMPAVLQLHVSPNPFDQQIQVQLPPSLQNNSTATIYNSLGQAVLQQNINNSEQLILATDALPQGAYWLNIRHQNGQQASTKVVKF
jgi:subtilisin family serine protease